MRHRLADFVRRNDYPCWCGTTRADPFCAQMFRKRFAVLRCSHCRTHRILPRAIDSQRDAAALYSGRELHNCLIDAPPGATEVVARMLQRLSLVGITPREGARVLDVGCADGELLATLGERFGCRVEGIEIDTAALGAARARHPDLVIHENLLEDAPLKDGSYDLVVASAILEHVVSPLAFLERLANLLTDAGEIFVLTPNAESLTYRVLRSWWRELLAIGEHIYLFGPESLAACADRVGLRLTAIDTDHDPSGWAIRTGSAKSVVVTAWSFYRNAVKTVAHQVAGPPSGDILNARLVRR